MNQQGVTSPQFDSNQQPHNRQQHPLANYQFSNDELRALRECNTESFFQRSLPLGTGLGLAAYFGTQQGYLKPSVKYGAVPKVVVSVIVGYFLGKFSYQQKCAEKIMKLPNSKLAEVLKQRKKGGLMDTLTTDGTIGSSLALSPFTPNVGDIYTDDYDPNRPNNSFEMDVGSRPSVTGLDDIYRPSLDNPSKHFEAEIPIEPAKTGTTYDELRQRNREDYLKKQTSRPQQLPPENYLIRSKENSMLDADSPPARSKKETNKYGDSWSN